MRTIKFVILTIIILNVLPLPAQIRAVVVDGNVRTKESIIERELGFTKDQPLIYSDSLLGIWRMRLESTKLFNWVEITKNSIGDTLNVHVVERWYIWVKPEGGFLDRNFSEWWKNRDIQRLSIGATVYVNNILGQQGGFFVRQAKGFMAADGFGFQRPFLKYKNCNAWKFSLDNMRSRRAWINSENNQVVIKEHWGIRQQEQLIGIAEYKRRFEYKWQGVVRYKFARDYAAQDIEALNPQYFIAPLGVVNSQYEDWKQYTHSLVLGCIRDTRNQANYPTKGSEWKAGVSGGLQRCNNIAKPYGELDSKYRGFYTLGTHTSLAVLAQMRYRFGTLGYILQRQMGYGMEYVRGYEAFVFDGAGVALGKAAWRYQLLGDQRSLKLRFLPSAYEKVPIQCWFNIFADVGRTLSPYQIDRNPMSNQTLMSVGTGIDLLCYYDALARFDCSYNANLGRLVFNVSFFHAI
ncbi:MAG: FtsQ-type POTRA domain-containing protein [Bacteroidetes bacterium]|nr:FtsQ-type POTRA domain-containing protein [Bacteroidota bacterium]NBX64628.1 FtsQ-type POTRA domain-containing protein [Bacteroidota bacterium]